jgi:hypothetical protein
MSHYFPTEVRTQRSYEAFFEKHIRNHFFKLLIIFKWYDSFSQSCVQETWYWDGHAGCQSDAIFGKKQLSVFSVWAEMRDQYGHDILVTSREVNELGSLDLVWS